MNKRVSLYITAELDQYITTMAAAAGLTVSEFIRRLMDQHRQQHQQQYKQIQKFRASL